MNNTFRILQGHWLDVAKQIPGNSVHVAVSSPPYYGLRAYNSEPQVWLTAEQFNYQQDPTSLPELGFFSVCEEHNWTGIKQYKDSWCRGERAAGFHSDVATRSPEALSNGRWTCTEICDTCGAWRGELGQEPSPALYVDHLIQVFAEVWRVLRPEGILFVNIGDAYYNYRPGKHDDARAQGFNRERDGSARDIPSFTPKRGMKLEGYKEKDLMLIPWEFAIAMRRWGWYVRSTIVWNKVNPLSESVNDRPTNSWEPILMFTKSEQCYYDKWAITEVPTGNAHPRGRIVNQVLQPSETGKALSSESRNNGSYRAATAGTICPGGKNRRNVWTINTQGYEDKHYASFPEAIPELAIKAGSSEVGCCRQCGASWRRIVLKAAKPIDKNETLESRYRRSAAERGIDIDNAITGDSITLGWRRACDCYDGAPMPCTVLDPFLGRGTTLAVAVRFGRNGIGAELQKDYVSMIRRNVLAEAPLWVKEVVE